MSRQKRKPEHLELPVGWISYSFAAVFSQCSNFQFLYRHSGSIGISLRSFIHSYYHCNVSLVDTCAVDVFVSCRFLHVESPPCHTMCISLQGITAVRRLKSHRLERQPQWLLRCDPKVRVNLHSQSMIVLRFPILLEDHLDLFR